MFRVSEEFGLVRVWDCYRIGRVVFGGCDIVIRLFCFFFVGCDYS